MNPEPRKFFVEPPLFTTNDLNDLPFKHDSKHFELYYNTIVSSQGRYLPDHLRPVCHAITDSNIMKVMIIVSPGAGKSTLINQIFATYELGFDPNTSILGLSAGADLPLTFMNSAMNIIENDKIYHEIFPHVVPDKELGWSAQKGIYIKRTVAAGDPFPSYACMGITSKLLTGMHARIITMDDLHDRENSASLDLLGKVKDMYYDTIIGRQVPEGSKMIMIGRRWDDQDLYGHLMTTGTWLIMTLASIRDTEELYWDVRIPPNLSCIFNDYKASPETEDIKVVYGENKEHLGFYWKGMRGKYDEAIEAKRNKPAIFETTYQSNPSATGSRIFANKDFMDFPVPERLFYGTADKSVVDFLNVMEFDMLLQSWDTAYTANTANDASCGYTIGIRACERDHIELEKTVPVHYDIFVLDEIWGHFDWAQIQPEVIEFYNKWLPSTVLIENSAAGIPLLQTLPGYGLNIVGVDVQNVSKRAKAIDGARAGSAQGWSRQHRIYIPRTTAWAEDLIGELTSFTGARGRQDDRVDALIQVVNYVIDLSINTRELPEGWRTRQEIDERMKEWAMPNHPLFNLPKMYGNVFNPMYGLCGSCVNYRQKDSFCQLHKQSVVKLSTCPFYEPEKDQSQILNFKH